MDALHEDTQPVEEAPSANGSAYLSVDEAIARAPSDCVEDDVEVWGGKVRVRGLTAAQATRINQEAVTIDARGGVSVDQAKMARLLFEHGVVQPKFTAEKVRSLHLAAGSGFKKVVDKIEELSGTNSEEWLKAQAAFPGSDE